MHLAASQVAAQQPVVIKQGAPPSQMKMSSAQTPDFQAERASNRLKRTFEGGSGSRARRAAETVQGGLFTRTDDRRAFQQVGASNALPVLLNRL